MPLKLLNEESWQSFGVCLVFFLKKVAGDQSKPHFHPHICSPAVKHSIRVGPRRLSSKYLAQVDFFRAAQIEDLVEGEGQGGPAEARRCAIVDGPHERKGPGSYQLREEDAGGQGEAERHRALRVLGVFQQRTHQEGLQTTRTTVRVGKNWTGNTKMKKRRSIKRA